MPYFDRIPKEYQENEACFVFLNQGEFSVRAPEAHFDLDKKSGVLAKCLNYFFETNKKQQLCTRPLDDAICKETNVTQTLFRQSKRCWPVRRLAAAASTRFPKDEPIVLSVHGAISWCENAVIELGAAQLASVAAVAGDGRRYWHAVDFEEKNHQTAKS